MKVDKYCEHLIYANMFVCEGYIPAVICAKN